MKIYVLPRASALKSRVACLLTRQKIVLKLTGNVLIRVVERNVAIFIIRLEQLLKTVDKI